MTRLNKTSKLAFYSARRLKGDSARISDATGYSQSHVSNALNGVRTIPTEVANEAYRISRRRLKTSEKEANAEWNAYVSLMERIYE